MPLPPPSVPGGLPEPDAASRAHSERVAARVREEIDSAGGWISFARYMELVLHEPGLGYYAAGAARFGPGGDFVTAPELSPLFGAALAAPVAELLGGSGGDILELGAGSGALATQLLAALEKQQRLPGRYLILETSPDLAQRQKQRLANEVPGLVRRVEWVARLPAAFSGVILANEVLDALPIHLLAWRDNGIFERGVMLRDGAFAWSERPLPSGPLRQAAEAIGADPPYASEISFAVPALVSALAGCLQRGALLLLDYGFGRAEYYHPQRSEGTLMCHYRHRAHGDPFRLPGLQDITAHVDFTSVAEAGLDAGLRLLGYTTQAQFLLNSGIGRLVEEARPQLEQAGTWLQAAAGLQVLLSPAEMGELFKVMALGRGIDTAVGGFASGDRSRAL